MKSSLAWPLHSGRARFIAESFDFEQGFRHTLSRHACKRFRSEMIADTMPSLTEQIDRALSDGKLRADAAENIRRILSGRRAFSRHA